MTARTTASAQPPQDVELQRMAALLGASAFCAIGSAVRSTRMKCFLGGLPGQALTHLIDSFIVLNKTACLEKAVGINLRTFQRRKDAPAKLLSQEQSGRAWKFAEVLARATTVLGSQEDAEQWLERPAIGLDQRRPIDLLATPAGVHLVEDFLKRIE
jgi:putative toxin-antitoxin system antitoxin component (TIGR02293 family)